MNDQAPQTDRQPEDPRVRFAAEGTLLAWMRTGLALMGFGFVVARFGLFLREISNRLLTGLLAGPPPSVQHVEQGENRVTQ